MKRNQLHFGQFEHESTQFTTKSIKQKFNWNTSTKAAKEVLEGAYDNNEDAELTEILKLVLNNYVQITPSEKASQEIIVQQELTTISLSGRPLGHYKCLVTVMDKSLKVEERKELSEIQEKIAGCYVAAINYVICYNYLYKRWK